jgi:ribosomal protein L7/L12
MKLSRIKFAQLISEIARQHAISMTQNEIQDIDDMIDVDVPALQTVKASEADVNELLRAMVTPDGFISAIRAYRVLTGAGLKEAKDAVERYRIISRFHEKNNEGATLGDILGSDIIK